MTPDAIVGRVLGLTTIGWIVLEIVVNVRPLAAGGVARDRWSRLVLTLSIFAGVFAAEWLARRQFLPLPGRALVWQVLGLGVMWLGIGVRVWAIVVLGRYFHTTVSLEPGQRVVDAGPYHLVRHPSYTGGLVGLIGVGLTLGDAAALVALVVLVALGIQYRIVVEEAALSEGLGGAYRDYMRRTARLIPGVY